MESSSIQWSGGSIAAMTFSVVVFLIWLSVMLGNRRERKERIAVQAAMPEIKHPMSIGKTYRVLLKAQPALEGVVFVGRSGHVADDPLQNMVVFSRADSRRVVVKAGLIQLVEEI